ncbi:polysaccharide deacetylase family protein [Candidatus Omnitrophota bacterium]
MIIISIPAHCLPERTFIVDIVFKEFLGLDYQIQESNKADYAIVLENKKQLIIRDHFFSRFEDNTTYLHIRNIPEQVMRARNQFAVEADVPVIFGDAELAVTEDKIVCGADVFASSFFMLTRWEEYVHQARDIHNRFPAAESLAFKHDFLDRPVVNEYVEMLWNMLVALGCRQQKKEREFKIVLTHDVDEVRFWKNWKDASSKIKNRFMQTKDVRAAWSLFREYVSVRNGTTKDPFDTFDMLMDMSESHQVRSHFYLMSATAGQHDHCDSIASVTMQELMNKIKQRGHIIGFHPSYNSYNKSELWQEEKEFFERTFGEVVKEGRQHYLRFEVPITWQLWDDNNMERDLTLGFPEREGFRCGTCFEYSAFNILTRKKLRVKESPLIAMESSFIDYQKTSVEKMDEKIRDLIKTTKLYNGNFVVLWHNSSLTIPPRNAYKRVYENILCQKN